LIANYPNVRLEEGVGDFGDGELIAVRLLGADDERVGADREVDPRVRDEVGLELGEVDIEGAVSDDTTAR
jgi:hypothetical protein